jgi:hypothetical protein
MWAQGPGGDASEVSTNLVQELAVVTLSRPSATAPTTVVPAPRWVRPAVAGAAVASAAALVFGVLEARLPVGPGNAATHHSYPFLVLPAAWAFLVAGIRAARDSRRWAALAAVIGVGYAVNALLVAALSYAVTPQGAALPAAAIAWVEQWFFLVPDIGLVGLAVGLLPGHGLGRVRRASVGLVVGFAALVGIVRAVALPLADDTVLPNPFAIRALAPLTDAVELGVGVAFLLGAVLAIGSGIAVAVRSRREGRRAGLPAVLAAVAVLVTFVLQAGDGVLGAIAITVGPVVIAALCLHVVRAFAVPPARS